MILIKATRRKTFEEARRVCERRRWEYRRGYIHDGWEWEVTPCLGGDIRDDAAGRGRTLQAALYRAEWNIEEETVCV